MPPTGIEIPVGGFLYLEVLHMKGIFLLIALLGSLATAAFGQTPTPPATHLKVGMAAPDFTLTDTSGKPVKLSDFKGKKNVVLAFYVFAFTGG